MSAKIHRVPGDLPGDAENPDVEMHLDGSFKCATVQDADRAIEQFRQDLLDLRDQIHERAGIKVGAKADDLDRQAALHKFAVEHGESEIARIQWNETNPNWRYKDRRYWYKALDKALPQRRLRKLTEGKVKEAQDLGESAATIPMKEWISALRGKSS